MKLFDSLVSAQGGGDIPLQEIRDEDLGENDFSQGQDTSSQASNQDAGSSDDTGTGEVGDITEAVNLDASEDQRNQGFVGATASDVQAGFVGASSDRSGPPLAAGATFGGGVNGSVSSQFTAAAPNTNSGGGRGGQAAGFGAAANGVSVIRKSIRARLRPNFSAPRPSGSQVSNRFNDHFFRQPGLQLRASQFSITVENRTAFLRGTVDSAAAGERLVRQLRLEPSVYKIVNQLQISAQ